MQTRDPKALWITQGAAIAALYVVLTLVFAPISFGPVQVRIAEALCILPMFTPVAIPGLFIGCLIANLVGGGVIIDVIFGSLATLIGAVGAYYLRNNRWLVPVPAIIANTLIVPFVLKYGYGTCCADHDRRDSGMLLSGRALLYGSSETQKLYLRQYNRKHVIRKRPYLFGNRQGLFCTCFLCVRPLI